MDEDLNISFLVFIFFVSCQVKKHQRQRVEIYRLILLLRHQKNDRMALQGSEDQLVRQLGFWYGQIGLVLTQSDLLAGDQSNIEVQNHNLGKLFDIKLDGCLVMLLNLWTFLNLLGIPESLKCLVVMVQDLVG